MLNELDLKIEAANAIKTKDFFKGNELLKVPFIFQEFSSRNIIVMEKVSGIPCTEISEIHEAGLKYRATCRKWSKDFPRPSIQR